MSVEADMGSTNNSKVLVADVTEALKLGADAVSLHINVGAETEPDMLKDLGKVSRDCDEWGVPLLVMAYARGPDIDDPFDPHLVAHCARVAAELGADLIKCNYTGDPDSFKEVVKGALVPVIIAGGPKTSSDLEMLNMVRDSLDAGGRGVSIGRNIFQHKNVESITRAVTDIVLRDADVEEAAKNLRGI